MSCGVGHRHGSDLALPWLWCRLAAIAPIQPLAWELPHTVGAAPQSKNETKQKRERLRGIEKAYTNRLRISGGQIILFLLFRATPPAYRGSQARSLIRATAASLHHSHGNARSEPSL